MSSLILNLNPVNFLTETIVCEGMGSYHVYPSLKIVCDACCRVPENRQSIPQHKARGKAACGYLMLGGNNEAIIEQKAKYLGELTIDQAEYHGVIFALDRAAAF